MCTPVCYPVPTVKLVYNKGDMTTHLARTFLMCTCIQSFQVSYKLAACFKKSLNQGFSFYKFMQLTSISMNFALDDTIDHYRHLSAAF